MQTEFTKQEFKVYSSFIMGKLFPYEKKALSDGLKVFNFTLQDILIADLDLISKDNGFVYEINTQNINQCAPIKRIKLLTPTKAEQKKIENLLAIAFRIRYLLTEFLEQEGFIKEAVGLCQSLINSFEKLDDRFAGEKFNDFVSEYLIKVNQQKKRLEVILKDIETKEIINPFGFINQKTQDIAFTYSKSGASAKSNLTEFRKDLISAGFIDRSTTLATFNKVFKNQLPANPIKWLGNLSELYYLIKALQKEKKINRTGNEVWKITANCFVDANGNKYISSKFKGQKNPKYTSKLDAIVAHL